MRRTLLFLLLLCGLFSWAYGAAGSSPMFMGEAPKVKVGGPAPELRLTTLDGQSVALSDYRGKVVMLNFWATWCPPCRAEMPSMERLNQLLQGEDFVMLAVNVEENGAQTVAAFLQRQPHSFPVLLDSDGAAQRTYGVFRFPETFIINKNGVILNHILGAREWDDGTTVEYLKFLTKG